jgi:hypothetical protein
MHFSIKQLITGKRAGREMLRQIGLEVVDWIHLARDMNHWQDLIKTLINFGFRNMLRNSSVTERLVAFQEGLSFMELFGQSSRHYAASPTVAGLIPNEVMGFFNWWNPSSCTMGLGSTQSRTEVNTRNLTGGKGRSTRKADNISAIYEPIV